VFFYSFLIAIAAWILAWLFSWLVYLYEWLFIPSVNDDALALLRKVCMRGALRGSTAFNGASVSGKPGLNLGKGPGDKVLVAPAIAVTLVGDQENLATTIDNLAASNRRQDAYLLWQTIRHAHKDGKIRIGWEPAGFGKPQVVDSNSVTDSAERPIVKVLPKQ
jgi:hypothetical protein